MLLYLVRYTWNSVFLNSEGPEVANLIIVSLSYLTACTQEHLYNVLYRCRPNITTSTILEINTKFPIFNFREKPGTKWKFRQCCRLWTTIFYCWMHRRGWWLCWKRVKFSSKSNLAERRSQRRRFTSALYIMNLVSLVAFENFKWLFNDSNCHLHRL